MTQPDDDINTAAVIASIDQSRASLDEDLDRLLKNLRRILRDSNESETILLSQFWGRYAMPIATSDPSTMSVLFSLAVFRLAKRDTR